MTTSASQPLIVSPVASWSAHHDWEPSSTSVFGILSDGRQLDVATHNEHHVSTRDRIAARRAWLRGGLFVKQDDPAAPPVLVLPLDQLTDTVVAEAVRRWLLSDVRLSA